MKTVVLIIITTFYVICAYGQGLNSKIKPPIHTSVIDTWPSLENPAISNNGQYFFYTITTKTHGSTTLIIRNIDNHWEDTIQIVIRYLGGFFSADGRSMCFKDGDTLKIISLASKKMRCIADVANFKKTENSEVSWLGYQMRSNQEFILFNFYTGLENKFENIADYYFDEGGHVLLLKKHTEHRGTISDQLQWIDLPTLDSSIVWPERAEPAIVGSIGSIALGSDGNQVAFIVQQENTFDKIADHKKGQKFNTLWYYKKGMEKSILKFGRSNYEKQGYSIEKSEISEILFTTNQQYIFCKLQEQIEPGTKTSKVAVDVWNYKDSILQSTQLCDDCKYLLPKNESIIAINTDGPQIIFVKGPNETIEAKKGNYVIVSNDNFYFNVYEMRYFPPRREYFLISLHDASRKLVKTSKWVNFSFSSHCKYFVYFDTEGCNYFSYNISTSQVTNISKRINTRLTNEEHDEFINKIKMNVGVAGWFSDDSSLLIYDNNDIWKVDVTGTRPPINLSSGYGAAHHIKFSAVFGQWGKDNSSIYNINDSLLLNAFNTDNKTNGFYKKSLVSRGYPDYLTMKQGYLYRGFSSLSNFQPIKAKNVERWIVTVKSDTSFPNFYETENFKIFHQLSFLQPQARVNWLRSQLVNWDQSDGSKSQGILYKPENFNSNKKYPLIVSCYEKKSDALYDFLDPDLTGTDINIPWFVSRGYLVFVPDIHYKIGYPGRSVINSIVSAVEALSKYTFIDFKKIGLHGHSFGGYEVEYLITHTNFFKAAVSGAGISDLISEYGSLRGRKGNGISNQSQLENGQLRIGATIWQRSDLYIGNSPIFKIDKVTTPILIMHNKADPTVPWLQSLEFFTALRRLDKKSWMLQYDNGGHGVRNTDDMFDYTKRLEQFFDHYLKDAPAPVWMTLGIPARLKQIETGYAYDPSGNCGKNCKICKMWNEKMKKDSAGTWREIPKRAKNEHWMVSGEGMNNNESINKADVGIKNTIQPKQ